MDLKWDPERFSNPKSPSTRGPWKDLRAIFAFAKGAPDIAFR